MSNRAIWAKRVAAWRTSGEPSTAFAVGKDFSASALRYWATRLEREGAEEVVTPVVATPVRIARLVREDDVARETSIETAIIVELGGARVTVSRGFDLATLRAVLEALRELEGAR